MPGDILFAARLSDCAAIKVNGDDGDRGACERYYWRISCPARVAGLSTRHLFA